VAAAAPVILEAMAELENMVEAEAVLRAMDHPGRVAPADRGWL